MTTSAELDARSQLAATLAQTEARAKKAEADAQRRGGEVNVIRQRHARQELHHQAQIEDERKIKAALAEKMEAREKEFKKQMEKLQLEDAFRVSAGGVCIHSNEMTDEPSCAATRDGDFCPTTAGITVARVSFPATCLFSRAQSTARRAR